MNIEKIKNDTITLIQTLVNTGAKFEDEDLTEQIITNHIAETFKNLALSGVSVSTLIQERRQWYLDNEYKELKGELPPFIKLKLDTDLRRDTTVINWMYSR